MERTEAGNRAENNVIHEDIFQELIYQFCMDNDIDDMRTASQSVWNSCLRYIYKHQFKNSNVLKSQELQQTDNMITRSNNNAYNYNAVRELLDIYIYDLCMKYDKEVSIIGFSTLTGIEHSTIYNWGNDVNVKLSNSRMDIYKKLNEFREESLSNKLATGNKNPVGILAILNRHYSWNLPGVSRESAPKQALTAADLPRLSGSELNNISSYAENIHNDNNITMGEK